MEHTSTNLELVKLVYNETTPSQSQKLQQEMTKNWELKEEYDLMVNTKKTLNRLKKQPSAACIDFILQYSQRHNQAEFAI